MVSCHLDRSIELMPSGLSATNPIEKWDTPMGARPSVSSQVPAGTPGGSLTTRGARSPYSFWTRSQASGGSLRWLSAEISLKSGIGPLSLGIVFVEQRAHAGASLQGCQ